MARHDHILFIGFMGSGKTSVSRRLSSITGLSLVDVDFRIEALQHRKIKQIFAEEGEKGFRRIETATLKGLGREPRSVISCGGGVVCNPANHPVLKDLGTIVYLKVPLEECIARISHPETRPLLKGPRPVAEIYDERLPLYEQLADITVETAGLKVPKVAAIVKRELEKRRLL